MFGGYLTLNIAFSQKDVQSSVIMCAASVHGHTCPLIDASGAITDVSFLRDSTASRSFGSGNFGSGIFGENPSYQIFSVAGLPAGKIYDVWMTLYGGIAVMGLLAWTTSSTCSPALLDTPHMGIPVNDAAITLLMDDGTEQAVGVHRATYIGSIRISDVGGVVTRHFSYGQNRECGIWNAHNQKRIVLRAGDPAYHWGAPGSTDAHDGIHITEYSPSWSPVFGNAGNSARCFAGRPTPINLRYHAGIWAQAYSGHGAIIAIGIGWNSITAPSGQWMGWDTEGFTAGGYLVIGGPQQGAHYEPNMSGNNVAYCLFMTKAVTAGALVGDGTSAIMIGAQETSMLLTAEWMG